MWLRQELRATGFDEMRDKTFKIIQIVEKLCELCEKPLRTEEREVKALKITDYEDYSKLLIRTKAHDRVEVDLTENKIYLYNHDYPGDAHPKCIENYRK
jgi:hypothetical protein